MRAWLVFIVVDVTDVVFKYLNGSSLERGGGGGAAR